LWFCLQLCLQMCLRQIMWKHTSLGSAGRALST
jgi:hypothetical protein